MPSNLFTQKSQQKSRTCKVNRCSQPSSESADKVECIEVLPNVIESLWRLKSKMLKYWIQISNLPQ